MGSFLQRIRESPTLARVAPFVLFLALTGAQDFSGAAGRYWFYVIKSALVGWMLWGLRASIGEMQWKFSWEAGVVGVAVFGMWVGLDPLLEWAGVSYPKLKPNATGWNPHAVFGDGSVLAWFFIVGRIAGSSLVVPPLEEVFYRSFLYRYVARADFQSVPLNRFAVTPFLVTALIFGLSHREWLAAILCAFAYQGLVCWKNRLGDAITAHALTNFLLGLWVVGRGAWPYW
jgi:hypothetical protein